MEVSTRYRVALEARRLIAHHGDVISNRNMFGNTLTSALGRWGLALDDRQAEQLWLHYAAIVDANRTMNLTRIVDPTEAAIKHFADSCAIVAWARDITLSPTTMLDLGTGPGFPCVPVGILRPDWSITAIDGTGKKIDFVRSTAEQIGLSNLRCVHAHSSQWDTTDRFDLITFRALAPLPKAIRESARFLAPGGRLVAYTVKTDDAASDSELPTKPPEAICHDAGMKLTERFEYDLQLDGATIRRELLVIERAGTVSTKT